VWFCENVLEGHVVVVPDLIGLFPRGSDLDSGLGGVVELDAGNGSGVLVLDDGVVVLLLKSHLIMMRSREPELRNLVFWLYSMSFPTAREVIHPL